MAIARCRPAASAGATSTSLCEGGTPLVTGPGPLGAVKCRWHFPQLIYLVWRIRMGRRALSSPKRRFPARAVAAVALPGPASSEVEQLRAENAALKATNGELEALAPTFLSSVEKL